MVVYSGCLEQDKEVAKMKAKASVSGDPCSIRKHAQTSQIDDSFQTISTELIQQVGKQGFACS